MSRFSLGSSFEAPACTICRHASFSPDESFIAAPLTQAPHHHPLSLNAMADRTTSLELLAGMSGATLAIVRDNRPVAVGKFCEWALLQLLTPGDHIVYEDGRRLVYQGAAPEPSQISPQE